MLVIHLIFRRFQYLFADVTLLGLNVVECLVREVGTVLRFVELCDHQVIAEYRGS